MNKQKIRILLVEDDPNISGIMVDELSEKYEIFNVYTGNDGIAAAAENKPEMILLDIMLPDITGFEVCKQIRLIDYNCGIIFLTAKTDVVDKIHGLEIGGDDYIVKPFDFDELNARIQAVLRRKQKALELPQIYEKNELFFDFRKNTVRKKKKKTTLSFLESDIMKFLIAHENSPVKRQEILENVWGYSNFQDTRTVDMHISSLRKKIGKEHILTVHQKGYMFVP
ncbi:MAG: response regulator transcription factor [Candidatus Omnitrophica bacterium]|nr:response regulator transcription factor [Candidatus Omnitrophota bacterium]MDD5080966.1 response regulator transcription factor [Candidatus Omnitrophota bacterium]MDD5440609.1 response regulator transcription factor [Candidatus Omnitrophota bacterium]